MSRRALLCCYTLELLSLATWAGGLVVIVSAVIPAVFNSFGMEAGGRFLTKVFDGYNRATVVAIAVLVSCSAARGWWEQTGSTTRGRGARAETILLVIMIVIAISIIGVLGPQSVALQEEAFLTKQEAEKKQAYDAFFRTHTAVRGLYLTNLALGIALMAVKIRNWTTRL